MADDKNKDSKYHILQRQEGKDTLSWIENFGLHLINDKSERCLTFGDQDHVLVLHIKNKEKEDTINAYYSYFSTNNKGKTRFCINAPFDGIEVTTNKLWELMKEKADWSSSETRRWWECVFPKGQFVDETTLQRVAVKDSSDMKMSEFVSSISAVFEKVIAKLGVDKDKFTKVCIVGHYAMALPVLYALRKMFKDKYVAPYVFTKNVQMKDNPWQQNSHCFLTPKKLCDTIIKSTPQMTISDVLSLREKGVIFTLPLSKGESGEYCLPITSVIDNSELKWNDLMKGDIEPDYTVGNLAFKRVQLSMFADGFQNVFVDSGESLVCLSSNNNGIVVRTMPVPTNGPKVVTTGTDSANTTENYGNETNKQKNTEQNPTILESIDYDDKADKIFSNVTIGIKRTTKGLEFIARNFLLKKYKKELPKEIVESEKEAFWKKKYEECMKMDWQKTMLSNWKKHKQIEFSNFASFLRVYQYNGLSFFMRSLMFSKIDSAVSSLKDMRNLHAHASIDDIISLGRTKVLFSMEHMLIIAEQLHDEKLKERLQKYKIEIEEEWDNNFTDYLNNKH